MGDLIGWMAAEAERPPAGPEPNWARRRSEEDDEEPWRRKKRERWEAELSRMTGQTFPAHQFPQPENSSSTVAHPPAKNAGRVGHPRLGGIEDQNPHIWQNQPDVGHPQFGETEDQNAQLELEGLAEPSTEIVVDEPEVERERRIYRGRTVGMLRRYLRYSIETGRLPSLLGREFFRSKVTSYIVTTFEDRVIFVHDMETCLDKLDQFSRDLIARYVLQEHDRWATARLLNCNEKTIRRLAPVVLDLLAEILLDVGLLERLVPNREKACQGGNSGPFSLNDCEESKNNGIYILASHV